jgi:hypothetical protein
MKTIELENLWKSQNEKIDQLLTLNKEVAINLSKEKLNKQIGRMYRPKWTAVLIGVPYTILLIGITVTASLSGAFFVALGFGAIALIMAGLLLHYFQQLFLISQVRNNEEVLATQEKLSKLRISSFKSLNLAVAQLPFWSVCWMSLDALKENPWVYGGINLLVFLLLAGIAWWLYRKMSDPSQTSKIRDFFLSGREWEPILKSTEILEQIKELKK